MKSNSIILGGTKNVATRLVKGCPCYKELGDEKLCVNDDDVLPIRAISVDPSFFAKIDCVDELSEYKSDSANMCYLLIYLDDDKDNVYCVSRGIRLHINNQEVKASDIKSALNFVTSKEMSTNGVVCSSCLYKYLVTLGHVFDDIFTKSERAEMIENYVRELFIQMALDLGGGNGEELTQEEKSTRIIREQIEKLNAQRTLWTQKIAEIRELEGVEELRTLLEHYNQLYRLEAVFLLQVMTLKDSTDQFVALGLLKFMVELSEHVLELNNKIRETTHIVYSQNRMPQDIQEMLDLNDNHRKMSEYRFSNLVKLLNQIEV
ncbi:MAG: hypothetical protein RTU92_11985 [Candidatus Thorarchaeota archaeon]